MPPPAHRTAPPNESSTRVKEEEEEEEEEAGVRPIGLSVFLPRVDTNFYMAQRKEKNKNSRRKKIKPLPALTKSIQSMRFDVLESFHLYNFIFM